MPITASDYPPGLVLEQVPCPNGCRPDDRPVLSGRDRLHGIPGEYQVVCCGQCGLMRTNPRPNPETMGLYYPDDYGPYQTTPTRPKPMRWRHRAKARLARWFGRDIRRLPDMPPGHMLEVGCASGAYLLDMQSRGWSVEGIEFSPSAAQTARGIGLSVQTGSLESAGPPGRTPDVITAWMVLEHLHEPVRALERLRAWVHPQGWLVGVVPDADTFDRRLFGDHWYALQLPTHLFHYTPQSLGRVLDEAGWELVRTRWQPNERNLLNSWSSWLQTQPRPRQQRFVAWLKDAHGARRWRRWLGWLLGVTRQSGRMEFWARPKAGAGAGTAAASP